MMLLTIEHLEYHEKAKFCYLCRKKFEDKYANNENIVKLEITVIIQVNKVVLPI